MADSVIPEEPPDENEEYESVDEGLDAEDAVGAGPEGERDFPDLPVDEVELEEVGANLDDPDELPAVLSGGMDDPDEPDPDAEEDDYLEAGDEVDEDAPGLGGTAGEVVDTATPMGEDDRQSVEDLDRIAEDAPGVDSSRW
jgi:hypothetical protein